jgi:hypothetical protein
VVASTASSAATASARPSPRPEQALSQPSALGSDRRAALLAAKLRALVTDAEGDLALESSPVQNGAAARAGERGWFLAGDEPARALGPALAWAERHQVTELRVLAEDRTGVLARRAEAFVPTPGVWAVEGRSLRPATSEEAGDTTGVPPPEAEEFALLLRDLGVDVVVEHGELSGEVLGLEVARVVRGDDGVIALEVGVGRHDREAFATVHGDLPTRHALQAVIDVVRAQRRPAAEGHPLSRLAPERWARAAVVADPGLVGCAHLEPVVPVLPRVSVKEVTAACAVGEDLDGRPVLVAASVGIDLDLVPTAAEARDTYAPGARLLLAVPERDAHPITHALAARLRRPAEVVVLPADWRASAVA